MSANGLPDLSGHPRLLGGIDLDSCFDNAESNPVFLGYPEKGLSIFRKARPAISGSGVKKFFTYSSVKPYPPGYVLDVAAYFLAKVGDFIYEAYLGRKECVSRVFYKLCGLNCGNDKGGFDQIERPVDSLKHLFGPLRIDSQHDPVGTHEIVYCRPLPKELRVAGDIKGGQRIGFANNPLNLRRSAYRHSTLVYHHRVIAKIGGHLAGGFIDV